MFRNDSGGFLRPRIPQIQQFFRVRRVESHERNVNKGEDVREATIQHRSPELGKVRVTGATRVYRRGDAMVETNQRIYAIQISFVPVAMKIDQPRTDVFAGYFANIRAAGRVEVGSDLANTPV